MKLNNKGVGVLCFACRILLDSVVCCWIRLDFVGFCRIRLDFVEFLVFKIGSFWLLLKNH